MQLRNKGKVILQEEMSDTLQQDDLDMEELLHKEKHVDLLKEAVAELGEEQKICISLFYLQEKSYIEIASETGYEPMKVKSFIQNGRRNLKILMDKKMKGKK